MPPNLFAVVMATGIVSLAVNGAGLPIVAHILFWLNVVLFVVLCCLLAARCVYHGARVIDDLRQHARAPGFFTTVAATCILGNQCILLAGAPEVAAGLWLAALALWLFLTYTVLPSLMEAPTKPPLEKGLNGGWLLAVVATEAICVLGCLVGASLADDGAEAVLFVSLIFWLVGGMLYIWLIALIFYRCLFLPLAPGDLTPPYWINMGAMAIATLAGMRLVQQTGKLPLLAELAPFVKGMTLLFWATASWWIPMLLALGAWRHLRQHFPLAYDHGYWAAVFPLGMYTVSTRELVTTLRLPFLSWLPEVFVWVALAAWLATFAGFVRHLHRR
jgi:tellurite resistance protein TehA-like permease